jgi:hypothetical protein
MKLLSLFRTNSINYQAKNRWYWDKKLQVYVPISMIKHNDIGYKERQICKFKIDNDIKVDFSKEGFPWE